eukprot:2932189-Prymnesium_polylepis.1
MSASVAGPTPTRSTAAAMLQVALWRCRLLSHSTDWTALEDGRTDTWSVHPCPRGQPISRYPANRPARTRSPACRPPSQSVRTTAHHSLDFGKCS